MENKVKRYRWDAINDRIRDIKNPVGAEIGVFRGECSANLLKLHSGLFLYMIDSWSSETYKDKNNDAVSDEFRKIYQNEAKKNFEQAEKSVEPFPARRLLLKNFSIQAARSFEDKYFDFVFIDAAHDYESVKADILAWMPKIKSGGWIMGHDYGLDWPGVKKAVDEIFTCEIELDLDFFWGLQI